MKNKFFSYEHAQTSNIDNFFLKGVTEDNIRKISSFRKEPEFILDFRLKAFKFVQENNFPTWTPHKYNINLDDIIVYSKPKKNDDPKVKKQIEDTFKRIGINIEEQERIKKVAIDAVLDSNSVYTSHRKELESYGVIFCPFSEACIKYPDIIKKYLGTVVNFNDNYFAALNAALFSDGTFVYVPKNTYVPIDLSSYFRIDSLFSSQFERTLIICDKDSSVNYLEGCSAPASKINQLHAAVVEIICFDNSITNYFTLQNWYSGDEQDKNGVYNFVTKRGLVENKATLNWVQIEVGSAFTWKYPSCILKGDNSKGNFYSISSSNKNMKVDTGTKMIHIGKNTKSSIYSKSIVSGKSFNVFRSLVKICSEASGSKNFTCCDTLITGNKAKSLTLPTFTQYNFRSFVSHEARLFKRDENLYFYLKLFGMQEEEINNFILDGFVKNIINMLPEEFYIESKELLSISSGNM